MNPLSNNASGTDAVDLLREMRGKYEALHDNYAVAIFDNAIATIESVMALPGKWLAEAEVLRLAGDYPGADAAELKAGALEAIFGPAPPATDAPEKPVVVVGTIGHVDHGKTALAAALTKVARMQDATPPAGGGGKVGCDWAAWLELHAGAIAADGLTDTANLIRQAADDFRRLASGSSSTE